MAQTEIPSKWNGVPTQYTFLDGFKRAGFWGKVLYVLGFPEISIVMEIYRYSQSSNAEKAASSQQSAGRAPLNQRKAEQSGPAPDINPSAPQNGKFQATEKDKAPAVLAK